MIWTGLTARSQSNNIESQSSNLVPFDVLAPAIEQEQHVKLYFKPDWFKGLLFRESLSRISIKNSIEVIKRTSGLNCIVLPPSSYVFVPVEVRNYTHRVDKNGVIMVGNAELSGDIKEASLTGKIRDYETGKALPGARINIDKLGMVNYADEEGNYSLNLPLGEFEMRLNYGDYKENSKVLRVGGNGIVDFDLSEFYVMLREVLVTDRAADLNVIGPQMSRINLNAKAIKELPMFMGEKDIIKSVTLLPGVQSSGEFGTGFFVRGGGSDQNLILVEDVPLFNTSHLFGLNSAINPDGVKSVSLMKSGIPARFGERVSSVMDIRLGSDAEKLTAKGGIGLLNSRLNLEIPMFGNKVNLLLGARSTYSNWLLHALPDVKLRNSSASFYDLNGMLTIRPNKKNSLSLFAYMSDDSFSFTPNSPYHYDNLLGSVRYVHLFNEKWSSTILLGHSRYRNDITQVDTLDLSNGSIIHSAIQYDEAKIFTKWIPNKKHSFEFGMNSVLYRLQPGMLSPSGEYSTVQTITTQPEKGLESAIYMQDDFTLNKDWMASIGLRYSGYAYLGEKDVINFQLSSPHIADNILSYTSYSRNQLIQWYNSIEPRMSFRRTVDESSSVKFSYNRISQFINLITKTAVMAPTDVYKLSSPNVPPLVSDQLAMGYFRNFNNNDIEASLEIYYKHLSNIPEYRDGGEILVNNAIESVLLKASGYNYGAELFIRKNHGPLTGWASYTYSRSMRHTTSPYKLDQINRNEFYPSPYDKPHNLVLNATWHLSRRWRVAGVFSASTGKPITLPEMIYEFNGQQYVQYSDRNKYRLPDYHRLDIAISFDESLKLKQKWKGSWTLSILNLYGHRNPYSVFYNSPSQLEKRYRQSFDLYQMFIIDRPIPTFTYNFSFN